VGFLEVVIEPEEMKMEKKKVKAVLDWLMFWTVKKMQKFLGLAHYYWKFVKYFTKIAKHLCKTFAQVG